MVLVAVLRQCCVQQHRCNKLVDANLCQLGAYIHAVRKLEVLVKSGTI